MRLYPGAKEMQLKWENNKLLAQWVVSKKGYFFQVIFHPNLPSGKQCGAFGHGL